MSLPNDETHVTNLKADEQSLAIIARLRAIEMEKQMPFTKQVSMKGMDYRIAQLLVTLLLMFTTVGALLILLLGSRHPVTQALILGFSGALICLFFGSAAYYAVRQFKARRTNDPLSPDNLKSRIEYEQCCVKSVLELKPTDDGLERTALELKAQMNRHTGYAGARNEFFRNFIGLALAALLLVGITPNNAAGELSSLIATAEWMGAWLLIISFILGLALSAKVSRFDFWLSVIELARFQKRQAAAG